MGSDEPEANRLQGTASIHTVRRAQAPIKRLCTPGRAERSRLATSHQIEGWFPAGERDSVNVFRTAMRTLRSHPSPPVSGSTG